MIEFRSVTPPSATSHFTPSSCSISLKAAHVGASDSGSLCHYLHSSASSLQEASLLFKWMSHGFFARSADAADHGPVPPVQHFLLLSSHRRQEEWRLGEAPGGHVPIPGGGHFSAGTRGDLRSVHFGLQARPSLLTSRGRPKPTAVSASGERSVQEHQGQHSEDHHLRYEHQEPLKYSIH